MLCLNVTKINQLKVLDFWSLDQWWLLNETELSFDLTSQMFPCLQGPAPPLQDWSWTYRAPPYVCLLIAGIKGGYLPATKWVFGEGCISIGRALSCVNRPGAWATTWHESRTLEYSCSSITQEVEAGGSEVQGHPPLLNRKFKVSLGCVKTSIK